LRRSLRHPFQSCCAALSSAPPAKKCTEINRVRGAYPTKNYKLWIVAITNICNLHSYHILNFFKYILMVEAYYKPIIFGQIPICR
jgi:hypothetical protein